MAKENGYLAVDFFFVLSGFVIGYAYDDRWDKMTTWGFFKRRLTRLLYPFLCGLLISRILPSRRTESNPGGSPIHLKGGFWWCSLAIVVLFSIPCIGGKTGVPDGIYQAACILLLFPLIVLAGSGSVTTDKKSTAICKWLGDLSYPLYITHYPLMYMQMSWVAEHRDAPVRIVSHNNLSLCLMALTG